MPPTVIPLEVENHLTLEIPESIMASPTSPSSFAGAAVIYPDTRIINKPGEEVREQVTESLLRDSHYSSNIKNMSSELNNNNKINSIEVVENQNNINNSNATTLSNTYLGQADKINIESNRAKYFSGLKSNLRADMETFLELIWALVYLVYGVTASLIIGLIPRRFRYKNVSGQVVLITGAGSGIGRMMAKKLALNHGKSLCTSLQIFI
jgi:hypothetical protein